MHQHVARNVDFAAWVSVAGFLDILLRQLHKACLARFQRRGVGVLHLHLNF